MNETETNTIWFNLKSSFQSVISDVTSWVYLAAMDFVEAVSCMEMGQKILKSVDGFLWFLEKSYQWGVPMQPVSQSESSYLATPHLTRPLPWILFLPILFYLRIFREVISILFVFIGNGPISAQQVVTYIQSTRRTLRSIKYHGTRNIRLKNQIRRQSDEIIVRHQFPPLVWIKWLVEQIKNILSCQAVRYTIRAHRPNSRRSVEASGIQTFQHRKRSRSPNQENTRNGENFEVNASLKELATAVDQLESDSEESDYYAIDTDASSECESENWKVSDNVKYVPSVQFVQIQSAQNTERDLQSTSNIQSHSAQFHKKLSSVQSTQTISDDISSKTNEPLSSEHQSKERTVKIGKSIKSTQVVDATPTKVSLQFKDIEKLAPFEQAIQNQKSKESSEQTEKISTPKLEKVIQSEQDFQISTSKEKTAPFNQVMKISTPKQKVIQSEKALQISTPKKKVIESEQVIEISAPKEKFTPSDQAVQIISHKEKLTQSEQDIQISTAKQSQKVSENLTTVNTLCTTVKSDVVQSNNVSENVIYSVRHTEKFYSPGNRISSPFKSNVKKTKTSEDVNKNVEVISSNSPIDVTMDS